MYNVYCLLWWVSCETNSSSGVRGEVRSLSQKFPLSRIQIVPQTRGNTTSSLALRLQARLGGNLPPDRLLFVCWVGGSNVSRRIYRSTKFHPVFHSLSHNSCLKHFLLHHLPKSHCQVSRASPEKPSRGMQTPHAHRHPVIGHCLPASAQRQARCCMNGQKDPPLTPLTP